MHEVDEVKDMAEVVTPPVGRGLRLVDMDDNDSTGIAHVDAGTEVTEVSKSAERRRRCRRRRGTNAGSSRSKVGLDLTRVAE